MTYGIIGVGNMGGALARVLASCGYAVSLCDHNPSKTEALQAEYPVTVRTAKEIVSDCDAIILAVKPQALPALLDSLVPVFAKRAGNKPVLITMAAAVKIDTILDQIKLQVPVIRIMPNTPLLVGQGMVAYATKGFDGLTDAANAAHILSEFCDALKSAGSVFEVTEEDMDAVTALSGSGPAFVYLFIESLINGAVECGMSREAAAVLAAQTVLGASVMVQQSQETPLELAERVCSPGGTTIEGMKALRAGNFETTVAQAIKDACRRSIELSRD